MRIAAAKHMVRLSLPGSDSLLQMTIEAKGIFDMDLQLFTQMYKKVVFGIYKPIHSIKYLH